MCCSNTKTNMSNSGVVSYITEFFRVMTPKHPFTNSDLRVLKYVCANFFLVIHCVDFMCIFSISKYIWSSSWFAWWHKQCNNCACYWSIKNLATSKCCVIMLHIDVCVHLLLRLLIILFFFKFARNFIIVIFYHSIIWIFRTFLILCSLWFLIILMEDLMMPNLLCPFSINIVTRLGYMSSIMKGILKGSLGKKDLDIK